MKQNVPVDEMIAKMFVMIADIKAHMATSDDVVDLKNDLDQIRTILDRHTDMLDRDELERLALTKQVDRHQDWIDRASSRLDVAADYVS